MPLLLRGLKAAFLNFSSRSPVCSCHSLAALRGDGFKRGGAIRVGARRRLEARTGNPGAGSGSRAQALGRQRKTWVVGTSREYALSGVAASNKKTNLSSWSPNFRVVCCGLASRREDGRREGRGRAGKLEPGGKELLFSHASGWAEPSKPENFEPYSGFARTDTCRVSRIEVLCKVPVRRSPEISPCGRPGPSLSNQLTCI